MPDLPSSGMHRALDELCGLMGVQRGYEAAGELHVAPESTVRAVLRALKAPVQPEGGPGDADVQEALRAVRQRRWQRIVEPVSVSWADEAPAVEIKLLETEVEAGVEVELVREDGTSSDFSVPRDDIRWKDAARVDGREFRRGLLPLPVDLAIGYHDLVVTASARSDATRLFRAPRATWRPSGGEGVDGSPRDWGVFAPTYALRSDRNHGVGDVGDLRRLARWTAELGGGMVGTLPLLPAFLGGGVGGEPYDPSPYAPVSRLFWNELYVELERAPGIREVPAATDRLSAPALAERAGLLRASDRVDYRAVMSLKREVLEPVSAAATGAVPGLASALETYAQRRPEAVEYARFRAYTEATGRSWHTWEGAARAGELRPDDAPDDRTAYHLYVQYAMDEQMRALREESDAGLYLDLPLGCHADGYDVWKHRDMFALGASGGAPPDAFFAGGQDWGFPPLDPRGSRFAGHAWFIASLRHLMRSCAVLRLDHVMSLHRLFWVPAGGEAKDGVYVRYPAEELWAVLCIESHRHRTEVVGEDLGTVPVEVPQAMRRHGVGRMWVLPFVVGPITSAAAGAGRTDDERRPDVRYEPPPPRSVASLDTHDMPPFASFWRAGDIDRRLHAGHLDHEEAPGERSGRRAWRQAVTRLLIDRGLVPQDAERREDGTVVAREATEGALRLIAQSDARLALVTLEDLWLEEEPQNVPGTTGAENWTRKLRRTLDEIETDGDIRAVLGEVDRLRRTKKPDDRTLPLPERTTTP